MSVDQFACVYFAGALVTALSTNKITHFYRAVLLWPLFWCLLLVVIVEMAMEDIRNG